MIKKTTSLFFLFFTCLWASAQSMYEVKFYFEKTDDANRKTRSDLKAFYQLNGDGTGIMRVIFGDSTGPKKQMAECELKHGFPKDDRGNYNYNKMFYTGKNVVPLSGDTTGISGVMNIRFWFKKKDKTGFFEPGMMTTRDENGKEVFGVITDMRLLSTKSRQAR